MTVPGHTEGKVIEQDVTLGLVAIPEHNGNSIGMTKLDRAINRFLAGIHAVNLLAEIGCLHVSSVECQLHLRVVDLPAPLLKQ